MLEATERAEEEPINVVHNEIDEAECAALGSRYQVSPFILLN